LTPAQRKVLTHVLTNSAKHSRARPLSHSRLKQVTKNLFGKKNLQNRFKEELQRRRLQKISIAQQRAIRIGNRLIQTAIKKRENQLAKKRIQQRRRSDMNKDRKRGKQKLELRETTKPRNFKF